VGEGTKRFQGRREQEELMDFLVKFVEDRVRH
jgi:hypothetical protein